MEKLSLDFIKSNQILPFGVEGRYFITKNTPFYAVEDIRFISGTIPLTEEIDEKLFLERLEEYVANYRHDIDEQSENVENLEDILGGSDSPVIQMLNSLFVKGIRLNASDIHFEPLAENVIVRFRLDGMLQTVSEMSKSIYLQAASRIKVMARLNVAEKRLPQDGRIRIKAGDKELDMRISTIPTVNGERVVIRLLDKNQKILTLDELGMPIKVAEGYKKVLKKPHGLILVTGPTGSGKSTTLYSSILSIKSPDKNILTIEDPVEYQIEGVGQIQVNPKIDLTFSNGLRSILRQDPDIILIGEIRDHETAEIAVHSSLTGHLVLATLHTNDAVSAPMRLIDLGVQPYILASSVEYVIAQRLVRKICSNCKSKYDINDMEKRVLNGKVKKLYRGEGCEECLGSGYKGRTAIYEALQIDAEMKSLISKSAGIDEIKRYLKEQKFSPLFDEGIKKAEEGITTIEEVMRVSYLE